MFEGFNNSLPPALRGGIKGGGWLIMSRSIKRRLPASPKIATTRARRLRKDSTDAERLLWSRLRSGRLGGKFRRQEPIGDYIVDFVNIEAGLIVELDGSQHINNKEYDRQRSDYLKSLGFRVIRFSDRDLLLNIEGVLSVIWGILNEDGF